MQYIYKTNGTNAELIGKTEFVDSLITQDTFPAREQREGYKAVLAYNEAQGVYWNYIALTGAEKREAAYQTEKCIPYGDTLITVDEANKHWQEYQAEGNSKATELTVLIATAKAEIRARFPD